MKLFDKETISYSELKRQLALIPPNGRVMIRKCKITGVPSHINNEPKLMEDLRDFPIKFAIFHCTFATMKSNGEQTQA